jgi:Response regulator of the LytR/AlgR family
MKKSLIVIAAWLVAILLVAAMVVSMGFSFPDALLIGAMFLPGAWAARFFLSKISFENRREGYLNAGFVFIAILVFEIALVMAADLYLLWLRNQANSLYGIVENNVFPGTLYNPVFISLVLTLLLVGDWALARLLEKRFPAAKEPVRFISERKPVSLLPEEILYIESNDKEVTVFATGGRRFRNRTGIAQWESLLGPDFVRIHRSYLVRRSTITQIGADSLIAAGTSLPISRKYRESVKSLH